MMTLRSTLFVAMFAALVVCALPASAADGKVTFTKDVLPILQENCQNCHRSGGKNMSGMIAPMSFMSYKEVRPWAKAIAKAVEVKEMPPWDASPKQNGHFINERTLTADEIATIKSWVAQGASRGNPTDAPEPVKFQEGWSLGEPDLVLEFPEPFFVDDDVQDLYHNVTVKITEDMLPEDAWVQMAEFRPGSEVVHHIIAYASTSEDASEVVENVDVEDDEEFLRSRVMVAGLAPGTDPTSYPDGFGIPLKKGAEMTFAMHYHKESGPGTGQYDKSIMAMKFTQGKPEHEVHITNIAHGAFEVPPNHPHWVVSGAKTFEKNILLINMMPHSHLRGVEAYYQAFYPDGTTEDLLDVPQYDFNWQSYYSYKEPKFIPAGTRIEYETIYDNSPENAERVGFDSNRAIKFGGPTTDEMDLGWYAYTEVNADEAGD